MAIRNYCIAATENLQIRKLLKSKRNQEIFYNPKDPCLKLTQDLVKPARTFNLFWICTENF